MKDLIIFILSSYGLSFFLIWKLNPYLQWKIFHCCYCTGFWSGIIIYLISNFTESLSFKLNIINLILLAFVSASTTYILESVIGDNGIKHEKNNN